MNLKDFQNISLEDIYWWLKAGRSKYRLTLFELRSDIKHYIKEPVFFLSTGRCGTKWFSDLLNHNKSLMVLHNPIPNLSVQSKLAYQNLVKDKTITLEKTYLKEIFLTGREQFLRYSYKSQKRYIETNNYITFFAPILIDLFPDAKFVHLYRHPGEFVRSGIRRNYYTHKNPDDLKRIVSSNNEEWNNFSQLQKTAWLWNETNLFIENFKTKNLNKCFEFNFNNLTKENVCSLLNFLNISFPEFTILKSLNKKSNAQTSGSFAKYENWEENEKVALRRICSDLATKYGYKL